MKNNDKPVNKTKDRLNGTTTLKVAHILDEFEKDDVKKQIDIIELFAHYGVELKKKGKNYIGICPWHKDTNPSLSVDKEKGVYNCFGCGESGDIFTLTEKMQNMEFKEALAYLKNWKRPAGEAIPAKIQRASELILNTSTPPEKGGVEKQQAAEETNASRTRSDSARVAAHLMPSPTATGELNAEKGENTEDANNYQAPPSEARFILNEVADYYHKKLYDNKEAIDYLHQRGLVTPALWARYKIGYADGTLVDVIGTEQKKQLTAQGIFTVPGKEHFNGCLVFPIPDEVDNTVGIYGRAFGDTSSVTHLYLKGAHRGVFNRKASTVYDEIILTESIIDALSLIELGIDNVQPIYGTNGFTEEHLKLLQNDRVKTIILALDNDQAGQDASEKLKAKLLAEGFAIKVIAPVMPTPAGEGKDWNDYLCAGGTKEAIREQVAQAETNQNEENKKDLTYEIKDGTYYITFDELTYRVIGFNKTFATEIKVNVRVYRGEENVYKVLNLYNDTALEGFICSISEEFGQSGEAVRRHFNRIIDLFEEEREREFKEKKSKNEKHPYVMTPTEEKRSLDILTGSDVIKDHVLADTEKMGLVGEEMNKIICYHAIISRLCRKPVNVCTLSMYGQGKSFLHDTMHRFVPDEDLKDYSRITKNDLYYREEENAFEGKILSVDEIEGIAESLYSVRTLISKGYLSISYPMMDPASGKLRNEENKVFGRPGVFVTGTNDEKLDEETLSRFVICSTDASNDQRLRIKQRQYYEMTRAGLLERRMEDEIVNKHKNVLRMIKKAEVLFPESWHSELAGIDDGDYSVRNNLCYLSFIASAALLDQHNRKIHADYDDYGKFNYVEATKEDVRLANKIMLELFGKSVRDLKPPQRVFLERVQKYAREQVWGKNIPVDELPFYEKDIRSATKLSPAQVSVYLNDLIALEYITLDSRGTHNKKRYRLEVADIHDERDKYLKGLLDPEVL